LTVRLLEREGFAAVVLRMRAEGISDLDLLTAVEQTPRSLFVPPQSAADAYSSRTIPIECGAFMEGIDTVIRLLHHLRLKPGQRVLEVGTGSGFTAAVMGRMTERVLTVDRYKTLTNMAQKRLEGLAMRNVVVRQADGSAGMPGEGTFDRILVTGAFPTMPRFYADQLVSGGSMITPVMISDTVCRMVRLSKTGSRFEREELFDAPYLPIIPQIASYL
jgi:protein-L-isoaspartate(D-aspartate) O-methyltransferase